MSYYTIKDETMFRLVAKQLEALKIVSTYDIKV